MRRFDFRADTATEDDVRRWQRQVRSFRPLTNIVSGSAGWILIGLVALYVYHGYLNYHSRFGTPTAVIKGRVFTARNVIVLVDPSGSMRGTEHTLQEHLDELKRVRISGVDHKVATQ